MSKKLAYVYHDLSTLLEAAVPVLRALDNIASRNGKLARIFARIRESVRAGETIADNMARYPRTFAPFDISVVRVGEESGALPDCLNHLARWYEFTARQRAVIISGCIYPFLIVHCAAAIVPLPPLILGRTTFSEYLMSMLAILALLYVPLFAILLILKLIPRRGPVRLAFDTFLLKIPVLGIAMRQLALSRFTSAFSIACRAGIPYLRCMQIALDNTANEAVARMLAPAVEAAREGRPMSEGFSSRLPDDFTALWEVGEETGDLDEVTERLARITADSAQRFLAELARWLPRIIYFIVLIIIALMILQMAGGIYSSIPIH